MKKVILVLPVFLLAACTDKNEYRQAVYEQMKEEKDIKDYKIDPERMTDCVVDTSSSKMPGIIPLDPQRVQAYRNYTRMLQLTKSEDPKKTLDELREAFGSPKGLAEAHANYAESVVGCVEGLVESTEPGAK